MKKNIVVPKRRGEGEEKTIMQRYFYKTSREKIRKEVIPLIYRRRKLIIKAILLPVHRFVGINEIR